MCVVGGGGGGGGWGVGVYPHNIFLTSPQKDMFWVLIRSASPRRF